MSGISKPYNNKIIIASQICFNNWLSSVLKSDDFREFGNITKSNATYFQKQLYNAEAYRKPNEETQCKNILSAK